MRLLRQIVTRIRALVSSSNSAAMHEEMRQHIERATERLVARGMSPAAAQAEARREFGNLTVIEEDARHARGTSSADALAADLRFAFRYFARHKATTAIIVTVLALGTGANTLIFSTFQAEFLRPAPAMQDDDAQARIWAQERPTQAAAWVPREFTLPELEALAARRDVFADVVAWLEEEIIIQSGDSSGPRAMAGQYVTPNYFRAIGVPLVAGQGFSPDVSGDADLTAVMAYSMAAQLYPDPGDAVGRQVVVNEIPLRVVGVAPPRFQGAVKNMNDPVLWIPLSARAAIVRISPRWLTDEARLSLLGRLAPGASRDQATAFTRQVVTSALPDSATRVGMARTAHVLGVREAPPGSDNELVMAFTLLLSIGLLVLLVAWMNVSSLMVAAAVSRRHEIAVRLSLGASRGRLLRQLVTESTLLAVAGGSAGLMLAWWVLTWMQKTEINGVTIAPDAATFAFTLGLAVASGVLFGLSPALHATRGGVSNALRDAGAGSTGKSRLQRTFVAAQIMLSQPLLVLLGTLLTLVVADYEPHAAEMSRQVIAVSFRPLETGAASQRADAVDSLVPRIAARPEVLGAVSDASGFDVRGVFAPDRHKDGTRADTVPTVLAVEGAAPGWFALVDVPIILGRDVSLADTAAAERPIVIGSDLARALWGSESPIGHTLASPPLPGMRQDSTAMTVVGVYDASRALPEMTWGGGAARGSRMPRVYTAHGKHWRHERVLVRTRGPAEPHVTGLQRFIREAAPSLPVASALTLAQVDQAKYRDTMRGALLAGAGGALALLLASLGLYGVVSLAVQQRKREIGVRIAVGAHPMRVARMFLASGVRVAGVALLLGLPLSIAGLRAAMSQGLVIAPEVNPYLIGVGITVVLLAVAATATWIPARRAALVDPSTTLRVE